MGMSEISFLTVPKIRRERETMKRILSLLLASLLVCSSICAEEAEIVQKFLNKPYLSTYEFEENLPEGIIKKFVASDMGTVHLSGEVSVTGGTAKAEVFLNNVVLWSKDVSNTPVRCDVKDIKVQLGDSILFKCSSQEGVTVHWDPKIDFVKSGIVLNMSEASDLVKVNIEKTEDESIIKGFSQGSSFSFKNVPLTEDYKTIEFVVGAIETGGLIQVRTQSVDGPVIASITLTDTSSYDQFEEQVCAIEAPQKEACDIYIVGVRGKNMACIKRINFLTKEPRGATVPFVTLEAEEAKRSVTAEILNRYNTPTTGDNNRRNNTPAQKAVQSASQKSLVWLDAMTEYVEFTSPIQANRILLRYTIPRDSQGTISMYINGVHVQDVQLDSTYCYDRDEFYQRSFDEVGIIADIKAGDKIRFQRDPSDKCKYYGIDLIDLEYVDEPSEMPDGYISVTDYGAVPDDGKDDTQAIQACLDAAGAMGKHVWLPKGVFQQEQRLNVPAGVNVKGAGMWHTELLCTKMCPDKRPWGGFTGFRVDTNSIISDIKISGTARFRDDQGIAIMGKDEYSGTNCILDNVWFTNLTTAVGWCGWSNSVIRNCRIRGLYADAIHFGDYPSVNCIAVNNHIRGCGDDGIAVVIREDYSKQLNRTATELIARFNTISAAYWGRGMAVVGGTNVTYTDNIIDSIYNAGLIITTEQLGESPCTPIENVKFQRNTINNASHDGHNHGGIHFWLSTQPMKNVRIECNVISNGSIEGIKIDPATYGDEAGRTIIAYNKLFGNKYKPYHNGDAAKIQPIIISNEGL